MDASVKYLNKLVGQEVDIKKFEAECGVGVVITKDQIDKAVADHLAKEKDLLTIRYQYNIAAAMAAIKNDLKWADAKLIKESLDEQILKLLGPKTEADTKAAANKKKAGKPAKTENKAALPTKKQHDHAKRLPDPDQNLQKRPEILAAHLKRTGGKIITRFPPEPNGYLHIGHAKSMCLNFGFAQENGGKCYIRLDDTNPEKENTEYIEMIKENIKWLGFSAFKVTHASDYFDRLLECAIILIKKGLAYVDHQRPEEIKACREKKMPSPYRDRPIEENLREFQKMREGRYEEGAATLRLKMDMNSPNPCMRDLVAYRIKYVPHPHVGNKYCVYPSYDFTHCINDSFEDITHSLCTLEFLPRRESYMWLLDALDMYKPVVWEFSRLNITHTVMSKRKLLTLVNKKYVNGWDDPRMTTLVGLKRKGYSPEAIREFCDAVGVTTNTTVWTDYSVLEHYARRNMEVTATRAMAVLDPLMVEITNYPEGKVEMITRPNHPADPSKGTNQVPFTKFLYIDRADFREKPAEGFWGLSVGSEVGLRYAYNITCTDAVRNEKGEIVKLLCTYDEKKERRPKGIVHWVAKRQDKDVKKATLRLYGYLFNSERPDELEDWVNDINKDSIKIVNAIVDETLTNLKEGQPFQFERVGFFVVDKDSTENELVFNRTVSLKESKEKESIK